MKKIIIDENFEGLMKVGSWYKYEGDILVEKKVEIKINLQVTGSLEVSGSLEVGGRLEVGEIKSINGVKTKSIKIIHGFDYIIWVMDNHIRIGCQQHSKKCWSGYDNKEIFAMDGKRGLKFWNKNKEWLLRI